MNGSVGLFRSRPVFYGARSPVALRRYRVLKLLEGNAKQARRMESCSLSGLQFWLFFWLTLPSQRIGVRAKIGKDRMPRK
jgi:hypothetical protein